MYAPGRAPRDGEMERLSSDDEDATSQPPSKLRRALAARRSHRIGSLIGVSGQEYRRMKRLQMPSLFFQLLRLLQQLPGWQPTIYDEWEWFCGLGMVQQGLVVLP